jgi:glutamate formiminotransferase/formiminotetrahydrofolate cyclodeaminase
LEKIVECVPNFSEGRDKEKLDKIADSIRAIKGVKLLSFEPDKDYNRSVVTFIGTPDAVKEAAFASTKTAFELIDMTTHKGEHPRLGAVDVVPFIPISNVSMEDCVILANEFGKQVGEELKIPVYLYEEAAKKPARRNLANIRKGEYEGLNEKLKDQDWKPDYGPAEFNPKSGGMVTGARFFLIAYNVNLNTNDTSIAHEIALRIRESGRLKKNENGEFVLDEKGKKVMIPGSLKAIKALGVLLERLNIAQVSINVVNYKITPPHIAFEEVKKEAETLGVQVTGSEIVGLTPKEALVMAGRFYAEKANTSNPFSEKAYIDLAIEKLRLSQIEAFIPEKKVIEYMI